MSPGTWLIFVKDAVCKTKNEHQSQYHTKYTTYFVLSFMYFQWII